MPQDAVTGAAAAAPAPSPASDAAASGAPAVLPSASAAPSPGPDASAGAAAPAAAAPVADATGAAKVADGGAAPAAPAAPAAAPAAPDSAAPAKADAAAAQSTPSLLEQADGKPKPDAKAADAKATPDKPAPTDAKAADAAADGKGDAPAKEAPAERPPAPVFEAFKFPDGVKPEEKALGQFTELLGTSTVDLELAVKSGDAAAIKTAAQSFGQKLVDFYASDVQRITDEALKYQRDHWNHLQEQWQGGLKADQDLGGNRLETSLSIAKAVIEEFGGTKEQQAELLAHTSANGMGNYVGFVRLLHNIGVKLNVFENAIVPGNPPSAKQGQSRQERWYKPPGAAAG